MQSAKPSAVKFKACEICGEKIDSKSLKRHINTHNTNDGNTKKLNTKSQSSIEQFS